MSAVEVEQPISRTYEYRKVMKPMLERKRRARINRCLDELKELMLTALQAEGENVSKLEKADILELTVQHLHKLRKQHRLSCNNSGTADADRFRAGFTHCATEVSRCLATTPGVDVKLGTKLMTHLGHRLNDMEKFSLPLSIRIGSNGNVNSTSGGTCSPAPSSPSSISSVESSVSSYSIPLTPPSPCSGKVSPTTFSAIEVNGSSHVQHPTMMPLTSSTNYNPNRLLTVISSNSNTASANNNVYTNSAAVSQHGVSPVWRPW